MKNTKIKVLIPTDFSVQSEFAYQMVKNLSQQSDMEVTFLHVLNVPDTVTLNDQKEIETCGEIDVDYVRTQYEMAWNKLEDIERKNEGVHTAIVLGGTTSQIVNYAEANNFDLIALGNKGSSGLAERIAGSEAQIVARNSSVPVLTLMCDRSSFELNNILLVHDFSENNEQSLDLLKQFIALFGTKLHLLQIAERGEDHEAIQANMQTFAQNNQLDSFEMHVLDDENVEEGVTHFNQMHDMDLVCIGTHGKGGLLYKSATERLINHLYKPVISFKIQ
ncbi:MAG: universal stress protein [Bacteroidota bacterium]